MDAMVKLQAADTEIAGVEAENERLRERVARLEEFVRTVQGLTTSGTTYDWACALLGEGGEG
jgi:hypothetical protein